MTSTTDALESAVMNIMQIRASSEDRPTARQRAEIDREYAKILDLIAPRIRHFTRQYGLVDHWEDAEQVCAIAVHRGIESYDPEKAKFTTFINWQLRGELQGLRFRLRQDQRSSAKKVSATTVSLDALAGPEGESMVFDIEDEGAEELTTSLASDHLAERATEAMIDCYAEKLRETGIKQLQSSRSKDRVRRRASDGMKSLPKYVRCKPGTIDPEDMEKLEERISRDRKIIEGYFFEDRVSPAEADAGLTRERERQITRRAIRAMAQQMRHDPRFSGANRALQTAEREPEYAMLPAGSPTGADVMAAAGRVVH